MNKKWPVWVALCVALVIAALLLSQVDRLTAGRIAEEEAKLEEAPQAAALKAASAFEAQELTESRYNLDGLWAGKDASGEVVGYVGQTTVTGYGGPVEVVAGVDLQGAITGVSVGGEEFAETPGLGALTREAAFTDPFVGKTPNIVLNEDGVDTVSGASTTSRAVVSGVNSIAKYIRIYPLALDEEEVVAYEGETQSATERGFAGDVTATVGFADDGTVEYLAVDTPDETDGLGKLCSEKAFTDQFLGKTGPFTYGEDGVEAVSGATFTSTAALNAINTIVTGEPAAPAAEAPANAPEPAAEPAAEAQADATAEPEPEPAEEDAPAKEAAATGDGSRLMRQRPALGEAAAKAEPSGPERLMRARPVLEKTAVEMPAADGGAERLMRARPVLESISSDEAAAKAEPSGAERLMRARPSLEKAVESAQEEAPAATGDGSRLMRQRPVIEEVAVEAPAEAPAATGDGSRLMRQRPAIEEVADHTTEEAPAAAADAERLMRARPAFTD